MQTTFRRYWGTIVLLVAAMTIELLSSFIASPYMGYAAAVGTVMGGVYFFKVPL